MLYRNTKKKTWTSRHRYLNTLRLELRLVRAHWRPTMTYLLEVHHTAACFSLEIDPPRVLIIRERPTPRLKGFPVVGIIGGISGCTKRDKKQPPTEPLFSTLSSSSQDTTPDQGTTKPTNTIGIRRSVLGHGRLCFVRRLLVNNGRLTTQRHRWARNNEQIVASKFRGGGAAARRQTDKTRK